VSEPAGRVGVGGLGAGVADGPVRGATVGGEVGPGEGLAIGVGAVGEDAGEGVVVDALVGRSREAARPGVGVAEAAGTADSDVWLSVAVAVASGGAGGWAELSETRAGATVTGPDAGPAPA